ncbi:MAG TPA: hypothetical protein PKA63_14230 [Oligoflexia bacterium]|nr:hypothetical protein [Oligoflexia bacterium]HMP49822.1 hypothetical protein [Oligoflexia bacterium]
MDISKMPKTDTHQTSVPDTFYPFPSLAELSNPQDLDSHRFGQFPSNPE